MPSEFQTHLARWAALLAVTRQERSADSLTDLEVEGLRFLAAEQGHAVDDADRATVLGLIPELDRTYHHWARRLTHDGGEAIALAGQGNRLGAIALLDAFRAECPIAFLNYNALGIAKDLPDR